MLHYTLFPGWLCIRVQIAALAQQDALVYIGSCEQGCTTVQAGSSHNLSHPSEVA